MLDHVENLLLSLRQNPWGSVAYCGTIKVDSNNIKTSMFLQFVSLSKLLKENIFSLHCAIIRKSAIDVIGGFDENLQLFEDWDFWIRFALADFSFIPVEKWTAIYRQHDNSSLKISPFGSKRDMDARFLIIKKYKSVIEERLLEQGASGKIRLFIRKLLFKVLKDFL